MLRWVKDSGKKRPSKSSWPKDITTTVAARDNFLNRLSSSGRLMSVVRISTGTFYRNFLTSSTWQVTTMTIPRRSIFLTHDFELTNISLQNHIDNENKIDETTDPEVYVSLSLQFWSVRVNKFKQVLWLLIEHTSSNCRHWWDFQRSNLRKVMPCSRSMGQKDIDQWWIYPVPDIGTLTRHNQCNKWPSPLTGVGVPCIVGSIKGVPTTNMNYVATHFSSPPPVSILSLLWF